jgi:dipeptidase D
MLELEPKRVWEYFEKISAIPRPSGSEGAIAKYMVSVGREHGLETATDEVGNVVIRVPATPGRESAPVTVLQGHLDMVCEKHSHVMHNFDKDPLKLRVEGNLVKATDTTLGADNGIGVAMALALLDEPERAHGPLELLFTLDEERGLNGALGLKTDFVRGRRMINLDTEEDGALYVGCAGGQDTAIHLRIARSKATEARPAYRIHVKGLKGGHSGSDIHEGRGNANRIMARLLSELDTLKISYGLASFEGGSKHNAIPREAFATIYMDAEILPAAQAALHAFGGTIREELRGLDDAMSIHLGPTEPSFPPMTPSTRRKVLNLLLALPHGMIAYSRDIPSLVETSTNLAIVKTRLGKLEVLTSQRSSVMSQLAWAAQWVASVGRLAGARVVHSTGYPAWKPNLGSPILKAAQATYLRLFGKEPKPKAIHAGLECGIIGDMFPGMDMVSLGPEIRNAHSPDEEVHIDSVQKTYRFLLELLKDIS